MRPANEDSIEHLAECLALNRVAERLGFSEAPTRSWWEDARAGRFGRLHRGRGQFTEARTAGVRAGVVA